MDKRENSREKQAMNDQVIGVQRDPMTGSLNIASSSTKEKLRPRRKIEINRGVCY